MLSVIALIVFVIGVLLYYMPGTKVQELGRAAMWIGLFFLIAGLTNWHAVKI